VTPPDGIKQLPVFSHRLIVHLANTDNLTEIEQLNILLTAMFQVMRVGNISRVNKGPSSGELVLDFDLQTTCPPHDLKGAMVVFNITQSRSEENVQ
jgi:hypothetical protein